MQSKDEVRCSGLTVGALLVDGHYGCRGAGPGQLTLCVREGEKKMQNEQSQSCSKALWMLMEWLCAAKCKKIKHWCQTVQQ